MAAELVESMEAMSLKGEPAAAAAHSLCFKVPGVATFDLDVEPGTTVRDLKKAVTEKCSIEPEHMRLIQNGRELKGSDVISVDNKEDAPVQVLYTAGHLALAGGG